MNRLPHRRNKPSIAIREPGGRVIAHVIAEDGRQVLDRRVGERERFRNRDAWPLGERAAAQACQLSVDWLRYRAPEGRYEVTLADFLRCAERLPFAHEMQLVLPRKAWTFTPKAGDPQQTLLGDGFTLLGLGRIA